MAWGQDTGRDERELEWWRQFALKFRPGNLPRPGSALLGYRFELMVLHPDEEPTLWGEHR